MRNKIKKYARLYICFWVISCLLPVMSWARLAVQTEVVSGNIAQKYEDRSIKLDNGKIYLPSREGLSIDLPIGELNLRRVIAPASLAESLRSFRFPERFCVYRVIRS